MDNTTTSSEKESFAVSCNTQLPARGVADMSATASPDSSSSSSANKHMKITPTTNAPTTVSTPPSPRAVTPTPLTPVDLARSTTPVSLSSKTGTANGSVKKKRLHAEGRWTKDEDEKLRQAVQEMGGKNWKKISEMAFSGVRSDVQCLHRWQKVLRPGLHKGPWSKEEDAIVLDFVHKSGGVQCVKWSAVANQVEGRLGKQVRERWYNHLDPMLNKGPWTPEEDALLLQLQAAMGNRWCEIAKNISGRSENAVKNRWNSAQRRARAQKENKKESKQKQKQKKNKSGGGGGGGDGTTMTPFMGFTWYALDDNVCTKAGFCPPMKSSNDLHAEFELAKTGGANGIVVWGSSSDVKNLTRCQNLGKYINATLGPILLNLVKQTKN